VNRPSPIAIALPTATMRSVVTSVGRNATNALTASASAPVTVLTINTLDIGYAPRSDRSPDTTI